MGTTSSQIKKVYHQKTKKLHPYKYTNTIDSEDATNQFTTLRFAYDVLLDDHLRRAYDQKGETRLKKMKILMYILFSRPVLVLHQQCQNI